jgi:hypothetical protein
MMILTTTNILMMITMLPAQLLALVIVATLSSVSRSPMALFVAEVERARLENARIRSALAHAASG